MSESTDPVVNPQAQRPGEVEPERTPGSAPSVVPLPDGADPDSKPGEHPLPEEAIEGYPAVAAEAATEPTGEVGGKSETPEETKAAPKLAKTAASKPAASPTSKS